MDASVAAAVWHAVKPMWDTLVTAVTKKLSGKRDETTAKELLGEINRMSLALEPDVHAIQAKMARLEALQTTPSTEFLRLKQVLTGIAFLASLPVLIPFAALSPPTGHDRAKSPRKQAKKGGSASRRTDYFVVAEVVRKPYRASSSKKPVARYAKKAAPKKKSPGHAKKRAPSKSKGHR